MKRLVIFAFATALSFQASASKLLILTDQPQALKAILIKKHISETLPFKALKTNEFSIEVKELDPRRPIACRKLVVKYTKAQVRGLQKDALANGIVLTKAELKKYRKGYAIDRVVECDTAELARVGAQHHANHVIFVRNNPYEGGSGGDIPIILSGSRSGIGLHEFLHTFGLADEYAYPKAEAALMCRQHHWANIAIFNDRPPYHSNEDVRSRHRDQLKWLQFLNDDAALVTGQNLGSPKSGTLGIFRSKTCDSVGIKSWKPSSHPTVMEDAYIKYIPKPYWPAILSGLGLPSYRIQELLKTTVVPTLADRREVSPGPPPSH